MVVVVVSLLMSVDDVVADVVCNFDSDFVSSCRHC